MKDEKTLEVLFAWEKQRNKYLFGDHIFSIEKLLQR